MRIGCLQFAPQVGDVSNNLNRADAVLSKADPAELENLDLLVLPEMAFSGYNFKSLDHIMPYLEPSGSGISALWARTTALKYDCTVAVGYPEKVDSSHRRRGGSPRYYNSLLVVNGDGETLANYRKTFLYYTDATWAQEGKGFFADKLGGLGRVAIGICMDINPYKFEAPWHAFEFGFHVTRVRPNLVILSMAWLTQQDPAAFTPFAQEPDMESLTYWVQRLEPLIRSESQEETIVVFCNRCGMEDDAVYAGTSAVIGIRDGEVSVYGLLGRGVKELLIVNTDDPPFAKLVNRPEPVEVPSGVLSPPQVSPTQERLGGVPEREEPPEKRLRSPPSPLHGSRRPAPVSPTAMALPESPAMVEVSQGLYSSLPSISTTPPPHVHERDGRSEADGYHFYKGCPGDCSGCDGHDQEDMNQDMESPICPSPTAISFRPKLFVSTGPEALPPSSTREPPVGTQPGNFFTRRDLCTPPMTAIDDNPMSAIERYQRHIFEDYPMTSIDDIPISGIENFAACAQRSRSRKPSPPAAAFPSSVYTPEEPAWPLLQSTTKVDFGRTPVRAPLRPPSGNDARTSAAALPSHREMAPKAPSRPPSRSDARLPSRPPSRAEGRGTNGGFPSRPPSRLSRRVDTGAVGGDPVEATAQEAGLSNHPTIPSGTDSPEYLSEGRDSNESSKRSTSRAPTRAPGRRPSRAPSREPSRDRGRNVSRERSRTRGGAKPSDIGAHRAFHHEPTRVRQRSRSASSSPVWARQPLRAMTAPEAGDLLTDSRGSILIVASPSVFKTTFNRAEVARSPTTPQSLLLMQSKKRSKSASTLAPFRYQPPPIPVGVRTTADFTTVWSGRGREPAWQHEPSLGLLDDAASSIPPHPDSTHPDIQAPMVTGEDAIPGQTPSKAEKWGRRRGSSHHRSISQDRVRCAPVSDAVSVVSI